MSFSVPTSPAASRLNKGQPVTPQRLPRQQGRSQSFYRSPLTPATSPYSPLSLRSADSTDSSILTTPENSHLSLRKRPVYSVDHGRSANVSRDKSLADVADNWRSRANENDVKAPFLKDGPVNHTFDDSSDLSQSINNSGLLPEDDFLAESFMATHRRLNSVPVTTRPRAVSHGSFYTDRSQPQSPAQSQSFSAAPPQLSSPLQSRRQYANYSQNALATPPPNRALARQLKIKGSLTDPAQPRRREAFGTLPNPSQNGVRNPNLSLPLEPNTSLDLFDINEDEFEYDHEPMQHRSLNLHPRPIPGYPNFRQQDEQAPAIHPTPFIADPFNPYGPLNGPTLPSISETVEQHFHVARQPQPFYDSSCFTQGFYPGAPTNHFNPGVGMPYPAFVPLPSATHNPFNLPKQVPQAPVFQSTTSFPMDKPSTPSTDCSVCLAHKPSALAILQPCLHPLCSSCLTSALNIVGEKDMECAICKESVADFKLISPSAAKGDPAPRLKMATPEFRPSDISSSFSSVGNDNIDELQSAFDFGLEFGVIRASTPKLERPPRTPVPAELGGSAGSVRKMRKGEDNLVLRIDNVPWDITPGQILRWLQQPVSRVHVLLDPKGKTLSHAYVEVADASVAGAILRGEAYSISGKKERGSVLGRGRRARGVTVTRSSQQELMRDLFPRWRGAFDGTRPVLSGPDGDRMMSVLEGGLLADEDISGLLRLIREPDSHFLKVPVLPFHSLISLLVKFPAEVDSRVFWTNATRDLLFDATDTALQLLLPRIEKAAHLARQDEEHTIDLANALFAAGLECKAFTSVQHQRLVDLGESLGLALPTNVDESLLLADPSEIASSGLRTPIRDVSSDIAQVKDTSNDSLDSLAKEFGVQTHVMQALAQRLSKMC